MYSTGLAVYRRPPKAASRLRGFDQAGATETRYFTIMPLRRTLRRMLGLFLLVAAPAALVAAGLGGCLVPDRPRAPSLPTATRPAVVLGYSAAWTDGTYPPSAYDYASLTHIARSFLSPHADGHISDSGGFWSDELEQRAHAHGVKLLASIGGAAPDANHWLSMARDQAALARFFDELQALIAQHHYDGVDIDWEPSAQTDPDQATYTAFMKALRQRFPKWIITTALGTGDWNARHISWREIAANVDYINLMTYVFAGAWTGHSAHNANLYPPSDFSDGSPLSVATNVKDIIGKYGVPAEKLTVGLAFYGIQFSTDRMGQPFPERSRYRGEEISYTQVARLAQSPDYAAKWDEGAKVPYLERKAGGHTLSYDDPRSIAEKCAFASNLGVGGVMIWYVGGDVVRGQPVLQQALAKTYGMPVTAPSIDFLKQAYRTSTADVERLQTEIARERAELERRSAAANAKIAASGVPDSFPNAGSDAATLDKQLANVDKVLGAMELERSSVQAALAALPALRGQAVPFAGSSLLFADFEGSLNHALGGGWSASFDKNGLGTVFNPDPPVWSEGGKNGQRAWHTWGHYGKSRAPWPYAALVASFAVTDFEPVASIRFWAKGNGKRYGLAIQRSSVHDYAFPLALFTAPEQWTQIELKTADFKQPDWGQKISGPVTDAIGLAFAPGPQFDDEDFELWIDDVELLKAP
jgi:chitinase